FDFCGLGIAHLLKADRVILASSVPLHEAIGEMVGVPKALHIPTRFSLRTLEDNREEYVEYSTRGFIANALESAIFGQNMFGYLEEAENRIFDSFYNSLSSPPFPGIRQLMRSAHSLIENVHPLLDLPRPTLNAIIPVGGITVKQEFSQEEAADAQVLLEEIAAYKEKGKKVVLVSFGTVMNPELMKEETRMNVINAMGNVTDAVFYWRVKHEISTPAANVKIHEWLPQNYLLASGMVDLFVSHMGIGSMTEAAYHGVPLVSIPLFVDQHYNYICARRLGITRFVDKASLRYSQDTLQHAIQEALNDGSMKARSMRLKNHLAGYRNQKDELVKHLRFILSLDANETLLSMDHHLPPLGLTTTLRSLIHLIPFYSLHLSALVTSLVLVVSYWFCCCERRKEGGNQVEGKAIDQNGNEGMVQNSQGKMIAQKVEAIVKRSPEFFDRRLYETTAKAVVGFAVFFALVSKFSRLLMVPIHLFASFLDFCSLRSIVQYITLLLLLDFACRLLFSFSVFTLLHWLRQQCYKFHAFLRQFRIAVILFSFISACCNFAVMSLIFFVLVRISSRFF
ncbi:hypothetical protein PMAYCL1PPCAC_27848, partial [Pristionchus mayeri]